MSAYFLSRVLAIAFAGLMLGGIAIAFFGIAWLIAIPIVTILRHYFPSLRPHQPKPIYINMHRRHDMILDEPRPTRAPARALPSKLKESGAYVAEPVEAERFPFACADPNPCELNEDGICKAEDVVCDYQVPRVVLPMGLHATTGPELPNLDPLIPIRKRALIRYLRSQHRTTPLTDTELVEAFLSNLRASARRKYL